MSILVFTPAAGLAAWWLAHCGLGLRTTRAGLLVLAMLVGAVVTGNLRDTHFAALDAVAAREQQAARMKVEATLASWARPDFIRQRRYPELVTAAGDILYELNEAARRDERAARAVFIKDGTVDIGNVTQVEDMLGFLKLEGCDVPPATALAARAILVQRAIDCP